MVQAQYCFVFRAWLVCSRQKIIKMQLFSHHCAGDPSFFFLFVWIQNCHFLSDEMQRTNKDGKCSKSASKDWPSSADIVVRSSHVGIIFCTKGDVLIKNLFITRSVPTSKVPSCSIMPEKTQGWYLEMGVTSGEPQKKRTFLSGNSQRGNVSCVDVGMETVSRFSLQWHFDPTSRSAP